MKISSLIIDVAEIIEMHSEFDFIPEYLLPFCYIHISQENKLNISKEEETLLDKLDTSSYSDLLISASQIKNKPLSESLLNLFDEQIIGKICNDQIDYKNVMKVITNIHTKPNFNTHMHTLYKGFIRPYLTRYENNELLCLHKNLF